MSTNPDPTLYNLVGKHVIVKNCAVVPVLIRGYSGLATDVFIRDDQVPFYRVKLDVVQANDYMTDFVKRLNEKCSNQNGTYLVRTAHVVETLGPTPDPLPNIQFKINDTEIVAMFREFQDVIRQAMDEFPGDSPVDRESRYVKYQPRMMEIFQRSVIKKSGLSLSDGEINAVLADLAESVGSNDLSTVIKKLIPRTVTKCITGYSTH
jgi:hypothetical protein